MHDPIGYFVSIFVQYGAGAVYLAAVIALYLNQQSLHKLIEVNLERSTDKYISLLERYHLVIQELKTTLEQLKDSYDDRENQGTEN